jgi:hypothetical protein
MEIPALARTHCGTNKAASHFSHEGAANFEIKRNVVHSAYGWREPMAAIVPPKVQENLARQLSESVERLQKQVEKVEFWASALTGFTRPIADYEPDTTAVARYMKPGRPAREKHRRRIKTAAKKHAAPSV